MFAFKQKWLYEESVVGSENPNFKAMEKILIDWVTIYNKSQNVYFIKEHRAHQDGCGPESLGYQQDP